MCSAFMMVCNLILSPLGMGKLSLPHRVVAPSRSQDVAGSAVTGARGPARAGRATYDARFRRSRHQVLW
jgi:hypothetical protein